MVLNKYDKKYREFLKAQKRLDEIQEELRKLPVRPLKMPYQRGWAVSVKLRDDIMRRTDAPLFENLLQLGYQEGYITTSLNDVKAIRRGEKFTSYINTKGQKVKCSLVPGKRMITEEQYKSLPLNVHKYMDFDPDSYLYKRYGRKTYAVYLPEYWLVLRARPHIVTHQYIKGGELEKEEQHLRSFLQEYWREWCPSGHAYLPKWKDERPTLKHETKKLLKECLESS